ncbi:hypothetical protein Nepgr_022888 [Nepenthes gracilis]|uniref:Uncharacterized protein n=1 Tax=Nepenthes gracilis TaxID=150966 RepID=A0AAD3XYU6_NEPGR|nr:hypothetical protein Nepgr_022888 [Nepenthes gracilis]
MVEPNSVGDAGIAIEVVEPIEAPNPRTPAPDVQVTAEVPISEPPLPKFLDRRPPLASSPGVFLGPSSSGEEPILEE